MFQGAKVNDVYYLREKYMRGLTVEQAAHELGVSTRTIFRMLKDGRLKAEAWGLGGYITKESTGQGRFYWIIDPMSVARIQVRKELEQEAKLEQKRKAQVDKIILKDKKEER